MLAATAGLALLGCQPNKVQPSSPIEQNAGTADGLDVFDPLSEADERDIKEQIERNWNLGDLAGSPRLAGMIVELRIKLLPDGTVTQAQVLNSHPSAEFPQVAESAVRAVMISSPLKLPPEKTFDSMVIRFHPDREIP